MKSRFPLSKKEIDQLKENDLSTFVMLDKNGIILSHNESLDDFKQRLLGLLSSFTEMENSLSEKGEYSCFEDLTLLKNERIPIEIMSEVAEQTKTLYGFSIDWVPGFFISQNVGLLWGGCAFSSPEDGFTVFLIRASFRNKTKWFIYERQELLAHELCHVARMPLRDDAMEEFFSYQTSTSRLRRYMGNCFQTTYDAILFVLPVFILLFAQIIVTFSSLSLPIPLFWVIAGIYPAFLFIRNQYYRNFYFKAKRNLENLKEIRHPKAILFRCNKNEIKELSKLNNNAALETWISLKEEHELRWKVFKKRFL